MTLPLQTKSLSRLFQWLCALFVASGLVAILAAQTGFRITNAGLTIDGYPQLTFNSSSSAYYVLYRSARIESGFVPARMSLGAGALTTLVDGAARGQTVFYTMREVPLASPMDLDQDGIDDVYELNRPEFLNPLYNIDADDDYDGDGISNLEEYQTGSDPAAGIFFNYTTFISSPDQGETGVSVNRETVLLFDRPLDSSVTLTTNEIYTTVSGRQILSRMEIASDRRSVSLFYLEPLPASSRVKVTFDGNSVLDNTGHVVDADHNGTPGGVGVIEFDTATITPIPATAVIGRVFASELTPGNDTGTNAVDTPLAGVWITVDGAEQELRAQTGPDGSFVLSPSPVGEFFVHIDGREAAGSDYPNGDYYPRVGKKWNALAGISTNLAGGDGKIYLPLVQAGTLKAVSPVADTTVAFLPEVVQANPALDGVRITVPANSLFSETGVRGGQVGIAPVPPDRLPEALPERLGFPLVITVQTDGPENFDRPVPVQFPNLPDRKTGEVLPPGAKTALWSFNHDMGSWETVGSMTISADGKFAVTDPGVGIRAPGWHGTDPGSSGGCDKPRGPRDDDDDDDDDDDEEDDEEEEEEDDDVPPGGDEPDGPGSGGSKGGGTPSGGSDDCEAGDCGCDLTGPFVGIEGIEGPKVVQDLTDPLKGTSPRGLYKIEVSANGNMVSLDVRKTAGNTLVLRVGPMQIVAWGFSPDDHRFVYWFSDAAGNFSVWLHDLENPTSGGPSAPFTPVWTRTVAVSSATVGFSPHGKYLFMGYNDRSNNKHVALAVVKAKGGIAYESEFDVNALGDSATWGWGPECDDRSFLYAFVPTAQSSTVRLVNLKTRSVTVDRNFSGDGQWKFSKCGDVFGLWHGPALGPFHAVLVKVATGAVLADVPNVLTGPIFFATTSTHHVVTLGGNEIQFPNEAKDPCATPPPVAPRLAKKAVQPSPADELPVSTGLHYYALKDLITGQIIERGQAGSGGVVHTRLVLGVTRPYRSYIIKASTLHVGWTDFISGNNGQHLRLPDIILAKDLSADADLDGLRDVGELIMGTNPSSADSDNDGISDSAEVIQGSNPSDGLPVATGVVGAAPTAGPAVDVAAANGLAVVAMRDKGVALFNVAAGLAPTLFSEVDTTGSAKAVALNGRLIAVADDSGGLVVIDATAPSSPVVLNQVPLGANAQAVVAAAGIAYVGLVNGEVVAVDMISGTVLNRVAVGSAVIQDLALHHDTLYALTIGTLYVLDVNEELAVIKSVASPGGIGAGQRRLRLFAGTDRVFATFTSGFNVFNTTDPRNPVHLKQNNTTSQGWKQIIEIGSGAALAAVGRNSTDDGPHDVSLYDLGPTRSDANVQATYETPGLASAAAIDGGLCFVADGAAGLSVINYLAYDVNGLAPTITLMPSFPLNPAQAEEGKAVRVFANVSDDVQVRAVEFYIDDVLILTDGNYPFEARFVTPVRTPTKSSFTLKARAIDTGGNSTMTSPITVALVPDATVPRIKKIFPGPSDVVSVVNDVTIFFSEPMDTSLFSTTTLAFLFAGADYQFGTADDVSRPYTVDYRTDLNAVSLRFSPTLASGLYRLIVNGVRDLAGNAAASNTNVFWVLPNGPEGDPDTDDLINTDEIANGTNPLVADSDGDGWMDGIEVADRKDPLNAQSFPILITMARPQVSVELLPVDDVIASSPLVVARPPVNVQLIPIDDVTPSSFRYAQPLVTVNLLPNDDSVPTSPLIVAKPGVNIELLPVEDSVAGITRIVVARPSVGVLLPAIDEGLPLNRLSTAMPPVSVRFLAPIQQAFAPLKK